MDIFLHFGLFHILIRSITLFLIFYLLYKIRRHYRLDRQVLLFWQLLGISHGCFLFFPYLKIFTANLLFLLPFKVGLSLFGFFLWILSLLLFGKQFSLGKKHLLFFSTAVFFGSGLTRMDGRFFFLNGTEAGKDSALLFGAGFFLVQTGFASAVLYSVLSFLSEKEDSLLFLKKYFLVSAAFTQLVTLAVFAIHHNEVSEVREWTVSLLHFAFLAVSFLLLKFDPALLQKRKELEARRQTEADETGEKLTLFLQEKKNILFENCSLKDLSAFIDIPEYRLRKYIQTELGFLNFREFLNYHRIEEACRLLLLEENVSVPVSRIAYSVGFGSASAFSRVFRVYKGMSPSEYRMHKKSIFSSSNQLA